MNFGVLGSGSVGQTIAAKLAECGHAVKVGTRDAAKLSDWQAQVGSSVSVGSFAEAAAFGEILFNCTSGTGSINALHLAGEANLNGKILIDISNPLDFSKGMPPSLTICNTDSLGEEIQRTFPALKVVKTLNTLTAQLMVNPALLNNAEHDLFVSGNDAAAKAQVVALLQREFGWKTVIDLGDITTARGTEMLLPVWVRLWGALQTPMFNFKIVR
ncbi:MAG: NAD(P)-binding domain-containing protein [Anaerolineae bacterium]